MKIDNYNNIDELIDEFGVRYSADETILINYTDSLSSFIIMGGADTTYDIRKGTRVILNYAFSGRSLTSITIPDSVTTIETGAFFGCENLVSIFISDSVTSIGDSAFEGCKNLISIRIPDSVTSIGERAFSCCSSLTSITIPDSVTRIGSAAFCGCYELTSATLSNSITEFRDLMFNGCRNLILFTIPNLITSFGTHAFFGCEKLTSMTIPNSITKFETFPIWGGLTTINVIGDNFIFEKGVLYNKDKTVLIRYLQLNKQKHFEVPSSVISIGNRAFYSCLRLELVTIPNSVTSIGTEAFESCRLTSITIPDSVTSIGEKAFSMDSLTTINVVGDNFIFEKGCLYNRDKTELIKYVNPNKILHFIVPDSVTKIRSFAFEQSWLKSIEIPNSAEVNSDMELLFGDISKFGSGHILRLKDRGINSSTWDSAYVRY